MAKEVLDLQDRTLHLVATRTETHLVVALQGELDLACTAPVERVNDLDLACVTTITVDLAGLEFCDSSGFAAFLRLCKRQGMEGREVGFVNPQPIVRRTFEVLGIDHLLTR